MAYPVKAVCEAKDIRVDGTSIIYLQFYAKDGKRKLNTGLSIPPKFWNSKQRIVTDKLPVEFGLYTRLNIEITRQLRLAEDIIEWGEQQHKTPIGVFVRETFRPNLNLNDLKLGIRPTEKSASPDQHVFCHPPFPLPQIAPCKAIIIPIETTVENGMIFPHLPADSPKNGRPWPNVFDQIKQYIKDKTGEVSPKTLQVYKNMGDHLEQFEKHRQEPISFLSFDFNFYDEYKKFLTYDYVHTHRKELVTGMKRNSVHKTIKQLRLFVQDRVKRKIIPPIDMSDFSAPEEETDAIYLNFDEIAQFYRCDLGTRVDLINDQKLFVLACLTGLRFSDFSQLKPQEDYRDGKLYKKTEKANKWVVVPLRTEAKEILEYFIANGFPKTYSSTFNENIKVIGRLAGLTQPITFSYQKGGKTIEDTRDKCDWITSHTGRRSFCTNEFLTGTPVKLIMSISGHKKEKDFYKYIRITAEEGAQLIKKLWEERGGMQAFLAPLHIAS
jgi:Site-specific recombinase XerD